MGDIVIVGTSHVARESARRLRAAFDAVQPAVVALELDAARAAALLGPAGRLRLRETVRQVGLFGAGFVLIGGLLQRGLGRLAGVQPGTEFRVALQEARRRRIPAAFIDRPLAVTARRLSTAVPMREKLRLLLDLILCRGPKVAVRLDSVPDKATIDALLAWLAARYPCLCRVLVDERNAYMAAALAEISAQTAGSILAVVGAAHQAGLASLLQKAAPASGRPSPRAGANSPP